MTHHRLIGIPLRAAKTIGIECASDSCSSLIRDLLDSSRVLDVFKEHRLNSLSPDDTNDLFDVFRRGILGGVDTLHGINGKSVVARKILEGIVGCYEFPFIMGNFGDLESNPTLKLD